MSEVPHRTPGALESEPCLLERLGERPRSGGLSEVVNDELLSLRQHECAEEALGRERCTLAVSACVQ